jgi:hypothetical protein
MSQRYLYPQIIAWGLLTNDSPELTIVLGSDDEITYQYLRVERINFSIYQAAKGGGGKLRFQDQDGSIFWEADVNGVKDISMDFGQEGMPWRFKEDIKALVCNAITEQAKLWLHVEGHIDLTGGTSS